MTERNCRTRMCVQGMLNPNCFQMIFDLKKGTAGVIVKKGQLLRSFWVWKLMRVCTKRYANEDDCWFSHSVLAALGKLNFCFVLNLLIWTLRLHSISVLYSYREPKRFVWYTYTSIVALYYQLLSHDVFKCNSNTMANILWCLWWLCQTSYCWRVLDFVLFLE